jgi:uncharacterized membrane protein YphA (DoxX/SURF4 family)
MNKAIALLSLLAAAAFAASGTGTVHNGFVTGSQFMSSLPVEKRAYAAGVIDGMLLAPLLGAPKSELSWFEGCVEGMTNEQIAAVLEKQLRDNPASWHLSAHGSMFAALYAACPKPEAETR